MTILVGPTNIVEIIIFNMMATLISFTFVGTENESLVTLHSTHSLWAFTWTYGVFKSVSAHTGATTSGWYVYKSMRAANIFNLAIYVHTGVLQYMIQSTCRYRKCIKNCVLYAASTEFQDPQNTVTHIRLKVIPQQKSFKSFIHCQTVEKIWLSKPNTMLTCKLLLLTVYNN